MRFNSGTQQIYSLIHLDQNLTETCLGPSPFLHCVCFQAKIVFYCRRMAAILELVFVPQLVFCKFLSQNDEFLFDILFSNSNLSRMTRSESSGKLYCGMPIFPIKKMPYLDD